MQEVDSINNDNLCIMDKNNIPSELKAVGVELIKLEKSMAVKGIPEGDIMKIISAIKNLKD
jgi:hypothetical protein